MAGMSRTAPEDPPTAGTPPAAGRRPPEQRLHPARTAAGARDLSHALSQAPSPRPSPTEAGTGTSRSKNHQATTRTTINPKDPRRRLTDSLLRWCRVRM